MAGTLDAMNVSEILPFLGHTEQSAGLSSLLLSTGFDVAQMLGRVQRGHGVGHLELKPLGIELAFQFHTDYKETYGTPEDEGKAVLSGVFAYDKAKKDRKAYNGPVPFTRGPLRNRSDALREFGVPYHTEQDDDEIDWDYWLKGGVQVGAFYRPDTTIEHLSFSVPFKTTLERLNGPHTNSD